MPLIHGIVTIFMWMPVSIKLIQTQLLMRGCFNSQESIIYVGVYAEQLNNFLEIILTSIVIKFEKHFSWLLH